MDADSMVFRHWEDVVFENRNKSYGAYLLRRAYANRLLSGLCITITLVALILSSRSFYGTDEIIADVRPPLSEPTINLTHPPSFEERQPRRRITPPHRANARNRTVIVTRDPVIEEPYIEAVTDIVFPEGFEDGNVGTLEGIGTVPVAEAEAIIEPVVRDLAEVMPQYEGGMEALMKFIQKKIRYPRAPQRLGIEGTVYVRFVVNGDGSVSDVEIIRGVHPDYDKEAMRVISMLPSWTGGSHHGRPVPVRMVMPLKFNLQ